MFKPNLEKLKWCMVWVLNHRHCTPNNLSEILFQAEIDHLNQNARPITGVTYTKGNPVICLEIEKLYAELNPLVKPLTPVNTHYLSISDVNSLQKSLNMQLNPNPYLQNLQLGEKINYQKMIFNEEVLEYLAENDSWSIVI